MNENSKASSADFGRSGDKRSASGFQRFLPLARDVFIKCVAEGENVPIVPILKLGSIEKHKITIEEATKKH